jgi:hypothetical protein
MSLLTAGELAAMRATADAALPDTCTISRPALVSDGAGGQTSTYSQVGGTIACRLSPAGVGTQSDEMELADRDTSTTDWIVTLPAGTDVGEKDRVLTGGRTFEVTRVKAPMSWEISRRVLAIEVK